MIDIESINSSNAQEPRSDNLEMEKSEMDQITRAAKASSKSTGLSQKNATDMKNSYGNCFMLIVTRLFLLKSVVIRIILYTGCLKKKYPFLTGNGSEVTRYRSVRSTKLDLLTFNLDAHTLHF